MALKREPKKAAAYITPNEVAGHLACHPNTVYRLMKRPGFPVLRIGGLTRIPRVACMEYLAKHSTGAPCDN
jgi:excisionase family DNA binding protein